MMGRSTGCFEALSSFCLGSCSRSAFGSLDYGCRSLGDGRCRDLETGGLSLAAEGDCLNHGTEKEKRCGCC